LIFFQCFEVKNQLKCQTIPNKVHYSALRAMTTVDNAPQIEIDVGVASDTGVQDVEEG
jgi:hypothetical protein